MYISRIVEIENCEIWTFKVVFILSKLYANQNKINNKRLKILIWEILTTAEVWLSVINCLIFYL